MFSRGLGFFQNFRFEIGGLLPKLARYHLRYASINKKLLNFVVVSYVVNPEF